MALNHANIFPAWLWWPKDMWVWLGSFFMITNFYRLDLHNTIHVVLANLQWNICKKSNWTLYLPWVSYGYCKCMFVNILTRYIGSSQLRSLLSGEYLSIFEDVVQSLLTMCFLRWFVLCSSPNHIPIKYRGPIMEKSHLRPIYHIYVFTDSPN